MQTQRIVVLGGVETRFHQFELVVPPVVALLREAGHDVTPRRPDEALTTEILSHVDALVSITTGGSLGQAQLQALDQAVREARNDRGQPVHFLGVHGASCSFENEPEYERLLGGRFLSHPPMTPFAVDIDRTHPVTRGVAPFAIEDEQYILRCGPDVTVLASAALGKDRTPVVWVRSHGLGKICYLALGHGPPQLAHPSVAHLIRNAVEWFGQADAE